MPSKLYSVSKNVAVSILYRLPSLPTKIHGRLVWIHPRARFSVTTRTFFKKEHHVRTWLTELLKAGYVFLDVGAHHGWVSLWSLPLVGKEGRVYSFEPSPANVSILEWHRSHNNFSQWTIIPMAVSNVDARDEEFFLIDTGDSPMNSLAQRGPGTPFMDGRDVRKIAMQTVTLDSFCGEHNLKPGVVKIDVEGAELLVLDGAGKLLTASCPTLILAVHPYWLPQGQSTQQIFDLLTGYGYRMYDSKRCQVDYLQEGEYLCLSDRARPAFTQ